MELLSGLLPVETVEVTDVPTLVWRGGKISVAEWEKALSFFQWSYDEFKGEAQLRIYYNEDTSSWAFWPMPQYTRRNSLHTKEIDTHELRDKVAELFPPPWSANGSAHHHCGSGAFQSSTDTSDEIKSIGLHVTLGKLDENEYELHARASFRGLIYKVELGNWFHGDCSLAKVAPDKFPEEWKTYIMEEPAPTYVGRHLSDNDYGYGGYNWNDTDCQSDWWQTQGRHNPRLLWLMEKTKKTETAKIPTGLDQFAATISPKLARGLFMIEGNLRKSMTELINVSTGMATIFGTRDAEKAGKGFSTLIHMMQFLTEEYRLTPNEWKAIFGKIALPLALSTQSEAYFKAVKAEDTAAAGKIAG